MKYFSMFTGIGGFEYGIEKAWEIYSQNQESGAVECSSGRPDIRSGRNMSDPSSTTGKQQRRKCTDTRGNKKVGQLQQGIHKSQSSRNTKEVRSRPECIGYSEINKWATSIYQSHWPEHRNYGDATRIVPDDLPDFDVLVGGFPCQTFSIAGKRAGFEDTRGTLFFEIARIMAVKRPKLCVLENVKGLLSHDSGRTFGTILTTLSDMGYICEWQVLNSKNAGVPQNRERVFIIGHLGAISGQTIFPIGYSSEKIDERCDDRKIEQVGELSVTCTKRKHDTPKEINEFLKKHKKNNTIQDIADKLKLPKSQVEHYFRVDSSRSIPTPEIWNQLKDLLKFDDTYDKQVIEVFQKEVEFESSRRVYGIDGVSPTIDSTSQGKVIEVNNEIKQVGELTGGPWDKRWRFAKAVFDPEGISPTINSGQGGGTQTKIVVETKPLIGKRSEEAKQIKRESMKNGKDYSPFSAKDMVEREDGIVGCLTKSKNCDQLISIKGFNMPNSKGKIHQQDFVHNQDGIMRTLPGGKHGNAGHYTKIMVDSQEGDVSKMIKQRTTEVDQEEIRQYLIEWRKKAKVTVDQIEKHFGNQAGHHWLEKNGSLPSVDDWPILKKLLNFDDKYDIVMTTFRLITEWELMQEHKARHQGKGNGFGYQVKEEDEIAGTLTAMQKGIDYNLIGKEQSIRRLTPVECERLQGFPDNWTKIGIVDGIGKEISDTHRYECCGNAVTTNVITKIFVQIYNKSFR